MTSETTWTAEAIKSLRQRLGLTQQEFATRLHVAVPTVNRWEKGHFKPTWHIARMLDEIERETTG